MSCAADGSNRTLEKMYFEGGVDLELTPQGTLAERVRAAGAGIPAFFTATGYGTPVQFGSVPMRHDAAGKVGRSKLHGTVGEAGVRSWS